MSAPTPAEETVCKEPGCSRVIDDIYTYCYPHAFDEGECGGMKGRQYGTCYECRQANFAALKSGW